MENEASLMYVDFSPPSGFCSRLVLLLVLLMNFALCVAAMWALTHTAVGLILGTPQDSSVPPLAWGPF